jgi:hypothetical protein
MTQGFARKASLRARLYAFACPAKLQAIILKPSSDRPFTLTVPDPQSVVMMLPSVLFVRIFPIFAFPEARSVVA